MSNSSAAFFAAKYDSTCLPTITLALAFCSAVRFAFLKDFINLAVAFLVGLFSFLTASSASCAISVVALARNITTKPNTIFFINILISPKRQAAFQVDRCAIILKLKSHSIQDYFHGLDIEQISPNCDLFKNYVTLVSVLEKATTPRLRAC